jgi:hypothetical protein
MKKEQELQSDGAYYNYLQCCWTSARPSLAWQPVAWAACATASASASASTDCVLRDSIATFYAQAMSIRFNKSTSKSTDQGAASQPSSGVATPPPAPRCRIYRSAAPRSSGYALR